MLSTTNGCLCHYLEAGQICISCRARKKLSTNNKCPQCKVGIPSKNGDAEYMRGLCSACFYGEI